MRTRWTVRVDELQTRLALGSAAALEPVSVSLVVNGLAPDAPEGRDECIDLEPVCRWITEHWPGTAPTPVLEARVNQLLERVFDADRRVQDAWVGLYRAGSGAGARRLGVERQASRLQFQSRQATRQRSG